MVERITQKYNCICLFSQHLYIFSCIITCINYKHFFAVIYFWYNNIIETDGMFHDNLKVKNLIPSSFDESDCERFEMYHNTQYYFSSINLPDVSICYDVSCICKDKGRGPVLLRLENYLNSLGLRTYFQNFVIGNLWLIIYATVFI